MTYLVIGNGRTAKHFRHYLSLVGIQSFHWCRESFSEAHSPKLDQYLTLVGLLAKADRVLLCISDQAIESFYREHLREFKKPIVHFSGALSVQGMNSVHPLTSFSEELYEVNYYKSIPFISFQKIPLGDLMPGFSNPSFYLDPEFKAEYHALCVMSGNFTVLLWQKFIEFLKFHHLPETVYQPYLEVISKNLLKNPQQALTGPFPRNDQITISKNINSLKDDGLKQIYQAFRALYFKELPEGKNEIF